MKYLANAAFVVSQKMKTHESLGINLLRLSQTLLFNPCINTGEEGITWNHSLKGRNLVTWMLCRITDSEIQTASVKQKQLCWLHLLDVKKGHGGRNNGCSLESLDGSDFKNQVTTIKILTQAWGHSSVIEHLLISTWSSGFVSQDHRTKQKFLFHRFDGVRGDSNRGRVRRTGGRRERRGYFQGVETYMPPAATSEGCQQ